MQPDDSPTALLDQPLYLLSLVGRRARAAAAEALAPLQLTLGQMAVLTVLGESGGASQRDVGRSIGKDPSDVVALLDGMEAAALIRRERDPDDRRRHLVSLTAGGRRTLKRADLVLEAATSTFVASLDGELAGRLGDIARRG